MAFNMSILNFYHVNLSTIIYFYTSKIHYEKRVYFYWKIINYISIFIIKLLMYNQFQIFNLINFIIHYMCPKKRHFAKMCTMIQKNEPLWHAFTLLETIWKHEKRKKNRWSRLGLPSNAKPKFWYNAFVN